LRRARSSEVRRSNCLRDAKPQSAGTTWHFAATIQQEGGPSILGSCASPEVTRLDLIRSFTKYARDHRSELDVRASAIVIQALADSYRCLSR
jgi:hypothetical protein